MSRADCEAILRIIAQFDNHQDRAFALELCGYDAFTYYDLLSAGVRECRNWNVRVNKNRVLVFYYIDESTEPDETLSLADVLRDCQ